MDIDLERWLNTFATGAAIVYPWQLTGRGWLRTSGFLPSRGWCPLLAQWIQGTGGVMAQCNSWEAGERQGLSAQACSAVFRAADHNPTGYDATLRTRLLAICHVEESFL